MICPLEKDDFPQKKSPSNLGLTLFEKTSEFYSWYLSCDMGGSKPSLFCENLSLIMQIAKLSFEGASLLSIQEELMILNQIQELSEAICNGTMKKTHLTAFIEKTLKNLIDNNPQARLISLLMKLEYKICIHNTSYVNEEIQKLFKEELKTLTNKISSSTPSFIANTISRDLEVLYKNPIDEPNFLTQFKDSIKWLYQV
ncbi:MAG: hypothetical protein WCG10_00035 [Chlamydiota bacterium]